MVHEYTERWKGFQFRAPVYLDGRHDPYKFDLVKWEQHEPYEVIDLETGEKKWSTENCFTIAWLKWNPKECYFKFDSCGTRYLEHRIDGLEEWILEFCDMMEKVLGDYDD